MKGNMNLVLWMWNNPVFRSAYSNVLFSLDGKGISVICLQPLIHPVLFLTQSDSGWIKKPSDKREEMGQQRIEQDKRQTNGNRGDETSTPGWRGGGSIRAEVRSGQEEVTDGWLTPPSPSSKSLRLLRGSDDTVALMKIMFTTITRTSASPDPTHSLRFSFPSFFPTLCLSIRLTGCWINEEGQKYDFYSFTVKFFWL